MLKLSLKQFFHYLNIPSTRLFFTEAHILVDSVGWHQVVARVLSAPIAARLREGVGVRAEVHKGDPMGCRGEDGKDAE